MYWKYRLLIVDNFKGKSTCDFASVSYINIHIMTKNYMIGYRIYLFLIISFLFAFTAKGQLVNIGDVEVNSGTDIAVLFNYSNIGTFTNNGVVCVHQNWENNGTVNFSSVLNTGETRFIGTTAQNITGTGSTSYYNILFNNNVPNAAISLQTEINIFGLANFTDGIIQESGNGLTVFHNDAGHTQVSDASFVDGKVKKTGNKAFVFPVGDDNAGIFLYRMAAISAPATLTDAFTAQYHWKNSNPLYAHENKQVGLNLINNQEYWEIEQTQGNSQPDVTLSWDTETTPLDIITDLSKLVIVRWDGTAWVNEGGLLDEGSKTIRTTPSGYGVFTLGTNDPAPVIDDIYIVVVDNQEYTIEIPENDDFIITVVTAPDKGQAIINADGTVSYIANLGSYCQTDQFIIEVCNKSGLCDIVTVNIDIEVNDSDDDTIPDAIETLTADTNGDGIPDYLDEDSDSDGIPDKDESGIIDPCTDPPVDTDRDGIPDYRDKDGDNIFIPEGFSPNGDGINDKFVITGLTGSDNELSIYNRWGSKVYHSKNYTNDWDGRSDNSLRIGNGILPVGTYYYILEYRNHTKIKKAYIYINY